MKYAIISDIHGNTNAFKAALLDAKIAVVARSCVSVILPDTVTTLSDVSNWQWRDLMFA